MKRLLKKIPVGAGQTRYSVTLIGDEVMNDGQDTRHQQWLMLRSLGDQPELMNCGPEPFQRLKMYFAGSSWVVEMEALVDEPGAANGSAANGST